jgi:hypothetical protein
MVLNSRFKIQNSKFKDLKFKIQILWLNLGCHDTSTLRETSGATNSATM